MKIREQNLSNSFKEWWICNSFPLNILKKNHRKKEINMIKIPMGNGELLIITLPCFFPGQCILHINWVKSGKALVVLCYFLMHTAGWGIAYTWRFCIFDGVGPRHVPWNLRRILFPSFLLSMNSVQLRLLWSGDYQYNESCIILFNHT